MKICHVKMENCQNMKYYFVLGLAVQVLILISCLMNIYSTKTWMEHTKLILLTRLPFVVHFISIFQSLFAIFFMWIYYKLREKQFSQMLGIFSAPFIAFELYFAYLFKFNVEDFIGMHMARWTDGYSTTEILDLQKEYNCCGFFKNSEFPAQLCHTSSGIPCVDALIDAFSYPLSGMGTHFFSTAFAQIFAAFMFYIGYDQEDDPYAIMTRPHPK